MATEIELKAHVENPEALKERITGVAVFSGSFEKDDAYWYGSDGVPPPEVRIRQATGTGPDGAVSRAVWVTYKTKDVRNGIEVNDEQEFTVSDAVPFEQLLRRLGLSPKIRKHKQGWAWNCEGITVEVAEIAGLGWFAELEIIADNSRPETVASARRRLLGCLAQLGIPEDKIEPKYYTEMLKEKTPETG